MQLFSLLDFFCTILLFLSTFSNFLAVLWRFGKKFEFQDGGVFGHHDVIATWYDIIIPHDTYQKIDFGRPLWPLSFIVIA